jgi:hypothetical protein
LAPSVSSNPTATRSPTRAITASTTEIAAQTRETARLTKKVARASLSTESIITENSRWAHPYPGRDNPIRSFRDVSLIRSTVRTWGQRVLGGKVLSYSFST